MSHGRTGTDHDGRVRRLVLTVTCPDRTGIVAAVTGFIASHGGWVVEAAQHGDLATGQFFQRIEILAESLAFGPDEFGEHFAEVADEYRLDWHLSDTDVRKRVVILSAARTTAWPTCCTAGAAATCDCDIAVVISTTRPRAAGRVAGIEFLHVPVAAGDQGEAFDAIVSRFEEARADIMVLARYMQILPGGLRAYPGASSTSTTASCPRSPAPAPTTRRFERGVKLIGATCHYVTADLDAGPIIEQDTSRIDHADTVEDLLRIGRDVERSVLRARWLRWHTGGSGVDQR